MEAKLLKIASQFALEGTIAEIKPLGEGFINDTFVVKTEGDAPNYILQRKNHVIFPDVPGMMENIKAVTEHIKAKVQDPLRETLTVIPAKDGKLYVEEDGNFWAVCLFIPDTTSPSRADTPELAYQGGLGTGRFQALLSDFTQPLNETIKGFHNIRWRFQQWDETVAADHVGRVADLQEEISWIESRRKEMLDFWSLVEDGKNLDNVKMDLAMFKAYTEGYLHEQKASMVQSELDYLAFSARYITFEQVLRFLMDYIDGDKYYKTAYPEHNLVRTRAQYKLLQSMEEQYEQMCEIVKSI